MRMCEYVMCRLCEYQLGLVLIARKTSKDSLVCKGTTKYLAYWHPLSLAKLRAMAKKR